MPPREFLTALFHAAVTAAHPATCLPPHLPPPPERGKLTILAAGKASGALTEAAERHYLDALAFPTARVNGIAVARYGYARPTRAVQMIEAGHPVPDAAGLEATLQTLALAQAAGGDDLVLALISGGASAAWIAPAAGVTLEEKQATTRALLACGASIGEINTLRKHLSRIKGGRLAARAAPARLATLAISDVPHDDPAVIGSGPTMPDPTTLADARAIVAKYALTLPPAVTAALADPANESPKTGDPSFGASTFTLVARPAMSLAAAERAARAGGYETIVLGDGLEGEARVVAMEHAGLARGLRQQGRRAVLLSGGELTVTVRGTGRGGPNQEYVLALALALEGLGGVSALAGDTDGTDGGSGAVDDPAGAYADASTLTRARALGLEAADFLQNNDSTGFFRTLGDLLVTGPTYTNVNDFRAILVDSP